MSRLTKIVSYLSEMLATAKTVIRIVYAIDKPFVIGSFGGEIVDQVRLLGMYVLGFALLGQAIATQKLDMTLVYLGIAVYALYFIIRTVTEAYFTEREMLFKTKLSEYLEEMRLQHVRTLDLGRMVDPSFVHLSHMVTKRGDSSIIGFMSSLMVAVGAVFGFVMSAAIMLALDPLLGLLACVMVLPEIMRRWRIAEYRRRIDEEEMWTQRQQSEILEVLTEPHPAVFVRVLKLTDALISRYTTLKGVVMANVRDIARHQLRLQIVNGWVTAACMTIFWAYFAGGIVDGTYSYPQIGAILGSMNIVVMALRNLGWSVMSLEQERRDYSYLHDFLQTRPLVDESKAQKCAFDATPEIVFDDVTFAYPNGQKPAVRECSFTVRPGEKVAFVGPNGCGKTTLLRLIARIFVASEGRVWADAHALDEVTQASWLEHLTMLTQAAQLPNTEVAYAITGTDVDDLDRDRFALALRYSRADEVVSELKHGLDTWIGEWWPKGAGFSTGQTQRLALASVIYRLLDSQSRIALFDEPTANCDAETKATFYASITGATEFRDKTVIISLHDPLYLSYFDRVIHFEEGKVVKDVRGESAISAYQREIATSLAKDL